MGGLGSVRMNNGAKHRVGERCFVGSIVTATPERKRWRMCWWPRVGKLYTDVSKERSGFSLMEPEYRLPQHTGSTGYRHRHTDVSAAACAFSCGI